MYGVWIIPTGLFIPNGYQDIYIEKYKITGTLLEKSGFRQKKLDNKSSKSVIGNSFPFIDGETTNFHKPVFRQENPSRRNEEISSSNTQVSGTISILFQFTYYRPLSLHHEFCNKLYHLQLLLTCEKLKALSIKIVLESMDDREGEPTKMMAAGMTIGRLGRIGDGGGEEGAGTRGEEVLEAIGEGEEGDKMM